MLLLFGERIILSENKTPVVIMSADAPHPLSILCVDDHTLIGDALVKVFAGAGYQVERADNGEAAWALISAAAARFDVLVTDHQMPRLTGLELVTRLRTMAFAGRIIVYSGGLGPVEAEHFAKLGVNAVVNKSPDSARLLAVVEAFHRQI